MSIENEVAVEAMTQTQKVAHYQEVIKRIEALLCGETDWVAAMATVVCELHSAFSYFDWTGFYRVTEPELLVIGPYQGGHGCLRIPFSKGVCGAAARLQQTQLVEDVHARADHIACASSTLSEIVVPVFTPQKQVMAVLDVDSDQLAAFDEVDQRFLELLCQHLGDQFGESFVLPEISH